MGETQGEDPSRSTDSRFSASRSFQHGAVIGSAPPALFVVRVEVGHAVQILLGLYDVQSLVLGGVGAAHSRLLARHRQIHTYNYYRLTVSDLIEPRGALRMSAPQNDKFM